MALSENGDVPDEFRRHKHDLNTLFAALTLYQNDILQMNHTRTCQHPNAIPIL